MTGIIVTIIGLLIGTAVACAGIYYLVKEKNDRESRKIYTIVTCIGIVIILALILKILLFGF